MAQFRATIQGDRGAASRLGSKRTGIVATVNGWDAGVEVRAEHENGVDVFRVYQTSGSNAHRPTKLLFTIDAGGKVQAA